MEKEKQFFLQVLADYMNKRPTQVPGDLDWSVLKEIGQAHQLTGVIYHQCKNSIVQSGLPDVEKVKWKRSYMYNFLLYSKRMALLKQIDEAFQKENIPYLIVKGTEIAKYYSVPAQRTMTDSDLLVHAEDKQHACDVLAGLGFKMDSRYPHEWPGLKNDIAIELHHKLIYDYSVELESIRNWGETVWENVVKHSNKVQCELNLTYHLVYTMLHLRKHLLQEGIGFRQFMDVAILALQPGINWQQVELWISEFNLDKFSQICFAFCRKWFDCQIQYGNVELDEDFYNEITKKIIAGGVFGSQENETKENNVKENIIFNEVRFAKSSSTLRILKRFFLPYNVMRTVTYCKFLDGRPYLLPVAWCWRLVYRFGKVVPLLKGAYDSETIKKKEDMLAKWGL